MRVAIVAMRTVHFEGTRGARRAQRLAERLHARGHDTTVFCTQWWDGYQQTFEHDGVTYRGVTTGIAPGSFATRLPFVLARWNPDVIHAWGIPPGAVLGASAGARLARSPLVADWFGDEDYPDSRHGRIALRAPDLTVAPSELVLARLRDAGLDGSTRRIPEPIEFDVVESTPPAEETEFVYARRLDDEANVDSFLLAVADLEADVTATVVGEGSHRERYEGQASDLRLSNVDFVGDIPRAERVALYRGAQAFIHTATWAPFADELCWALACGCVGVVEFQADSAAHELVEGYERGVLATDDEGVTDALREARQFPHRTIAEEFRQYDHGAVLDTYLSEVERL